MSAILSIIFSDAGIEAKKVGVGTIDALSKRDADFRNCYMAGVAYCEKVRTTLIMPAILYGILFFDVAENPAAHKNMGVRPMIRLDLFEAFVLPMDAILTVNHNYISMKESSAGAFCRQVSLSGGAFNPTSSANSLSV